MTKEEKAQAYDEALDRMKHVVIVPKDEKALQALKETIFPELAESEDERIRKHLITIVELYWGKTNDPDKAKELAYLEKQKAMTAEEHETVKVNINGIHGLFPPVGDGHYIDEHVALDKTAGEKQKEQSLRDFIEDFPYSAEQKEQNDIPLMNGDADLYFDNWIQHNDTTKRGCFEEGIRYAQRLQKEQKPSINIDQLKSLMLQYLQEAANEKDDSDIEADTNKWARKILGYDFEQKEQKPAEYLNKDKVYAIMKKLHDLSFSQRIPINSDEFKQIGEITKDVRSLLDYPIEQKPAEWSEEDKSFYDSIICEVIKEGMHPTPEQAKWFKSLPERFNLQPKQEWSEEDEKYLNRVINLWVNDFGEDSDTVKWLKSLRPSWKPSKEQMRGLAHAINLDAYDAKRYGLDSLYSDLKKLM